LGDATNVRTANFRMRRHPGSNCFLIEDIKLNQSYAAYVGDKLGPYEIRSRVVAGGMSEAYAHETLFKKFVAQNTSG
jgi:hypothetical protein